MLGEDLNIATARYQLTSKLSWQVGDDLWSYLRVNLRDPLESRVKVLEALARSNELSEVKHVT